MKKILLIIVTFILFTGFLNAQDEARLLRFPAVHGDQLVFTYAGDLYTVNTDGGIARKLTGHEGFELFARFSPDGSELAFTAQYDGNTEVYVMPAEGGAPIRLTYTATLGRDDMSDRMGPNNIVMTWTNDGKNVIYRSRKQSFNSFKGQLFSVPAEGGVSLEIPLSTGGFCSYSPDGEKLAFNRVMREFRTWKYYKGGMADDIRIFDFQTGEVQNITNNDAQEMFPMWHGDKIYFLSNRDRTMNLFVWDTQDKTTTKLTNYTEYDIKFPSLGDEAIVYENGGFIYLFDLNTLEAKKLQIMINDDFIAGRNEIKDASKLITNAEISPDGKRLLFSARGDVFTIPAEHGVTRNLTESPEAHDRNAVWSPDGKHIAYVSDESGEFEIYITPQDGSGDAVQLTTGGDTYKYAVEWSPDSKKIMWADKKLRLQYIDIESKKITLVGQEDVWEYFNYNWSPDNKWIVYTAMEPGFFGRVELYNLESEEKYPVTGDWYSSAGASFSCDGKYIVFNSDRDFNPIYSNTEWNHAYQNMNRIYLVVLSKDNPNPFAPENDEVEIDEDDGTEEENGNGDDENGEEEKDEDIKIDTEGLQDRIISLPVKASNYWGAECIGDKIYYNERSAGGDGIFLKMYDLKKKKEIELGKDYGFEISADGKKMLVAQKDKYAVIPLPSDKIKPEKFADLSNMKVYVCNKKEWEQIYYEAWRQMRDFFYVENMHGLDWEAMKEKYAVLLPYVNNRNDLNYVIGELIGELNVGHSYVNGGDKPAPERIKTGLLGAQLSKDESGYFKVDKILKGENWNKKLTSPLTEIGVNVAEGDYILAVNGHSTKDMKNLYRALVGKAGKEVILTVNPEADEEGSRDVIVTPIGDEAGLYYYNWVQQNIDYVNEKTGGQVGYIHIPDMGQTGLNEFVKHFYPQLTKKALIIDDRGNGGGNVSPMIIERLRRKLTRSNMARNVTVPSHTPRQMMLGPMVCIIDQYSASDGDLFPYSFRRHGLGKLIGVTTWGGVVGIRGPHRFVDGGDMRKPEFASYSADESEWIIEGEGVDPDIWVDNDPHQEYLGVDAQLDKAIEVILEELKNYKPTPDIPKAPDKTK